MPGKKLNADQPRGRLDSEMDEFHPRESIFYSQLEDAPNRSIVSHTEMAHVLGFDDNPHGVGNTGWNVSDAVKSTNIRYNNLKERGASKLNFHTMADSTSDHIRDDMRKLESGDYVGYGTRWPGHAFTLHAIREEDQTHFIYVNRGWRHDSDDMIDGEESNAPTVKVFTTSNEDAEQFAVKMGRAARHESHRKMAQFIRNNPENEELTAFFSGTKGDQKVGNCTVANSNISWHFQLASDYMNSHQGASIQEAYENTEEEYKRMRMDDRVKAFLYFLKDRDYYPSDQAYLYDLMQALEKFGGKPHSKEPLEDLVRTLQERDPDALNRLINPLISNDFSRKANEFGANTKLHNAKDIILTAHFKGLNFDEQKKLVEENSSLLKYANRRTQDHFLDLDYGKYILHASQEEQNHDNFEDTNHFSSKLDAHLEQRKTSTWRPQSADVKEKDINKKLMDLYSHASCGRKGHEGKIDAAFKELCLACCQRRFSPHTAPMQWVVNKTYDKYSVDIKAAKWLIKKIQNDPDISESLGLGPEPSKEDIKAHMERIVKQENSKTLGSNQQPRRQHRFSSESLSDDRSDSISRSNSESVDSRSSVSEVSRSSMSVSQSMAKSMRDFRSDSLRSSSRSDSVDSGYEEDPSRGHERDRPSTHQYRRFS